MRALEAYDEFHSLGDYLVDVRLVSHKVDHMYQNLLVRRGVDGLIQTFVYRRPIEDSEAFYQDTRLELIHFPIIPNTR